MDTSPAAVESGFTQLVLAAAANAARTTAMKIGASAEEIEAAASGDGATPTGSSFGERAKVFLEAVASGGLVGDGGVGVFSGGARAKVGLVTFNSKAVTFYKVKCNSEIIGGACAFEECVMSDIEDPFSPLPPDQWLVSFDGSNENSKGAGGDLAAATAAAAAAAKEANGDGGGGAAAGGKGSAGRGGKASALTKQEAALDLTPARVAAAAAAAAATFCELCSHVLSQAEKKAEETRMNGGGAIGASPKATTGGAAAASSGGGHGGGGAGGLPVVCTAAALQAVSDALHLRGGRMLLFNHSAPLAGSGRLRPREHPNDYGKQRRRHLRHVNTTSITLTSLLTLL